MLRKIALFCSIILLFLSASPRAEAAECAEKSGGTPGQCAPDFTLKTIDGREIRLSSLRGNVVFLNFWATWCPPCATEIPAMERLAHKLEGKKFRMIAVSIDNEGNAAIRKYFQETFKGVVPPFPILLDLKRDVSHRYGTYKVPETYILDRTGRIRDKIEGVRDWDDMLIQHYLELLADPKEKAK
ncbi:MAG: TlpA disulfide reductase family protein [Pseudomonadota bacterium]